MVAVLKFVSAFRFLIADRMNVPVNLEFQVNYKGNFVVFEKIIALKNLDSLGES
jgi:hypothetical protein